MKTTTQNIKPQENKRIFNPFPGLRPFSINESHLFFGREGQSDEVLSKLSNNKFVAVIGASGSGKSSLIYCGLIPILHGGFITSSGNKWKMIVSRPGNSPIENLANAVLKSALESESLNGDEKYYKSVISSVLRSSSNGLIDAIRHIKSKDDQNFLVLIDQFEELFRFKRNKNDIESFNESLAFVKLFLNAIKQEELPIYVVLTMRSDFIGDCSQFQDLTKMINLSHYLIPQMTRSDFQEAISGPIAVGGAKVTPHLLQQLLNDVGDNPDQLPILQHSLMRTWDYWERQEKFNDPIDITHYEDIGGMSKALSLHANEAYDELSPSRKEICESIFKTLTEKGGDNRGIRHPSAINEIASIAQAEPEEVIAVIDKFRAAGRSFLTPAGEIPIDNNSIIDISHESLMRIWDKLKNWVDEEANAVNMYLKLAESAENYQLGKTALWRQPDLQLALNWREKQKPTLYWAQSYNPAYERTMEYLKTSEESFIAEEENKLKLQKRTIRRTRVFAAVLGVASIFSLGAMFYSFEQTRIAEVKSIEAQEQRAEAEKQKIEAEKQKNVAIEQQEIANQKSIEAQEQKTLAEKSAIEAEKQKNVAVYQQKIANQKSIEAQEQKKLADISAQEALQQKQAAEIAKDEAFNLRMLSISQSMAVKSLQISNDVDQKALVAYQAYLFNIKYEGIEHNPDVYSGLYNAYKEIKGEEFNRLIGHSNSIRDLAVNSKSNKLYTSSSDGTINTWIESDSIRPVQFIKNDGLNRSMAIDSDGRYLANCFGKQIQLFDLESNNSSPQILTNNTGTVWDILITDKNIISVNSKKELFIHDIAENKNKIETLPVEIKIIEQYNDKLYGISKDGSITSVLTNDNFNVIKFKPFAADNKIKLLPEGENSTLTPLPYDFNAIAINQDKNLLISGDKVGNIIVWDSESLEQLYILGGHIARINDMQFSPNGKYLGTASSDGTIRLWLSDDFNAQPIVLGDNDAWAMKVTFDAESKTIYGGYVDGLVQQWPVLIDRYANEMCNHITRNLTQAEWEAYIASDIDYEKTCKNIDENN
jgi:WD40 repeat protein/energy-coupling factor transporter ATP-binding protein EcfA2